MEEKEDKGDSDRGGLIGELTNFRERGDEDFLREDRSEECNTDIDVWRTVFGDSTPLPFLPKCLYGSRGGTDYVATR